MTIDNPGNGIRDEIDVMTRSANRFSIVVVVVTVVLGVLASLLWSDFFSNLKYSADLVQALLVCSTGLMAFTGLMIVEIKKTTITGLSSDDMLEKIKAINAITSLARAFVFLRWALLLSIFSILFSVFRLMIDNPILIIGSLATFLCQLYLFIWSLIFSDFLPA